MYLFKTFRRFLRDEHGVTAMEYSILVAMISVAALVGFEAIGVSLQDVFNLIAYKLSS